MDEVKYEYKPTNIYLFLVITPLAIAIAILFNSLSLMLMLLPVLPIIFGIFFIVLRLIIKNKHPLRIGNNGIQYGMWHFLGRDGFVAWQNISSVESFIISDFNFIRLTLRPNYIETNPRLKAYLNTWLKLGPSKGLLSIETGMLIGKHTEIFNNIQETYKYWREYGS